MNVHEVATFLTKMGRQKLETLEAIARSPIADQVMADIEKSKVERRKALVQQAATIEARHGKACLEATKAAEKARIGLEVAKQEVTAKSEAYGQAYGHSFAMSRLRDNEANEIERELQETCDPRIDQYLSCLHALFGNIAADRVELSWSADTKQSGRWFRTDVQISNPNGDALEGIRSEITSARELKLLPLTPAEVTRSLQAISKRLADPLASVERRPPEVTADEVTVTPWGVRKHTPELESAAGLSLH